MNNSDEISPNVKVINFYFGLKLNFYHYYISNNFLKSKGN